MTPRSLLPAFLLSASLLAPVCAEDIFKVDFSNGKSGEDVITAENAIPASYPGTDITYFLKTPAVTFQLASAGALPGQYALLTDSGKTNSSFYLRWAEDAEDKVISSGVLTVSWTMNFVSGADSDVSFQILRSDLTKDAARLARINVSSSGNVKIGGSTQTGAANDFPVAKGLAGGTAHKFVWTLDYATGVQSLKVDDGAAVDFASSSRAEQNFFQGAPAVALKIEVRGDDAVVAFDDFAVSASK